MISHQPHCRPVDSRVREDLWAHRNLRIHQGVKVHQELWARQGLWIRQGLWARQGLSETSERTQRRVPAGFMRAVSVSGSNMQPSNHHLEKNQTAAALTEPVGNNQ